jgi:hypothetical protein
MGIAGNALELDRVEQMPVNKFLMALAYEADRNYTEKQTRK